MSWLESWKSYKRKSGVGFYIKNDIKHKIIQHPEDLIEQGRSVGVEIGDT